MLKLLRNQMAPCAMVITLVGLVVASCGEPPGTVSTQSAGARVPSARMVVSSSATKSPNVPPITGPDDHRSPLERFFSVPVRPEDAARWDTDMIETATQECMQRAGFDYIRILYDIAPDSSDPNRAIFDALSADNQSRYSAVRWGPDHVSGCTGEASNRTHPMNLMKADFSELQSTIHSDPKVSSAMNEVQSCVAKQTADPSSPGAAPIWMKCQDAAGWSAIATDAKERYETAFIDAHLGELTSLRDDRPTVSAS